MAKRIFHLISELDIGGTERSLLKVLPHLQNDFENIVICAIGRGIVGKELGQAGISVHYLDGQPWLLYPLLRREKPDVLITYLIYADIVGRFIGKLAGVKKIISFQRSSLLGRGYVRWIEKITSFLVDEHVTQKEIPNIVELPDLSRWQKTAELTVTCVSNLRPGKGHIYLLRAWDKIAARFPGAKLVLVGDGPLRSSLPRPANVKWLGRQHAVDGVLSRSDLFILPSLAEGMSNALLEAMSWGLPCIACDIPTNRAIIISEENGLLVPAADAGALAAAQERLLMDAALRQKLGTAARQHIEQHHAPHVIVPLWLKLLS